MADGRGGSRPGAGRKPAEEKKVTKSISLPPADWEEIDRLAEMAGVTRSGVIEAAVPYLEDITMGQAVDRLTTLPAQAGIEEDSKVFLMSYLETFSIKKPLFPLGTALGWLARLEATRSYQRVAGSPLTTDDETMEKIVRYLLGKITFPVALVERAGGKFLVWWGETDVPEVWKFRLAGKVLAKSRTA